MGQVIDIYSKKNKCLMQQTLVPTLLCLVSIYMLCTSSLLHQIVVYYYSNDTKSIIQLQLQQCECLRVTIQFIGSTWLLCADSSVAPEMHLIVHAIRAISRLDKQRRQHPTWGV